LSNIRGVIIICNRLPVAFTTGDSTKIGLQKLAGGCQDSPVTGEPLLTAVLDTSVFFMVNQCIHYREVIGELFWIQGSYFTNFFRACHNLYSDSRSEPFFYIFLGLFFIPLPLLRGHLTVLSIPQWQPN
jgi:hypothetical protein